MPATEFTVLSVKEVNKTIEDAAMPLRIAHVGECDLTSRVLEVNLSKDLAIIEEYESPISEPRKAEGHSRHPRYFSAAAFRKPVFAAIEQEEQ